MIVNRVLVSSVSIIHTPCSGKAGSERTRLYYYQHGAMAHAFDKYYM